MDDEGGGEVEGEVGGKESGRDSQADLSPEGRQRAGRGTVGVRIPVRSLALLRVANTRNHRILRSVPSLV